MKRAPDDSPWPVLAIVFMLIAIASILAIATDFFQKPKWPEAIQLISALVVAAFTGLLVFYSHRGWQVANRSADAATKAAHVAETSLQLSERAYLGTQSWKLEMTDKPAAALLVFRIHNSGRTRGLMTALHAGSHVGKELPANPRFHTTFDLHNHPLNPDDSQVRRIRFPHLTEEVMRRVKAGEVSLWFVGRIDYSDMFGISHQTNFCMLWEDGKLVTDVQPGYAGAT